MESVKCLNCDSPLTATQAYCSVCGQKTDTQRLTLHDITHALIHVFTHADHSVFSLVRDLTWKPGRVARDYVAGKRRKYFNPFTFALIVVGVTSLVLAFTKFVDFTPYAAGNPVGAFFQRNINLIVLAQLPMLSLFCTLFFRSEKLHFAEHLVLASYATGFRSVFLTLIVAPLWYFAQWNYAMTVGLSMLAFFIYFGIACAQFYSGNRWWLGFKGFLVGALAHGSITAVIWLTFYTFYKFFRT
ncbi:MAG: DUF3667 domain-containing protein [Burkholderiales bacterium]|nr:DUF3667 domain-containing protein [Burkholderiales bacterium]